MPFATASPTVMIDGRVPMTGNSGSQSCRDSAAYGVHRKQHKIADRVSVGRIPAKVGSLWSLRVWGLRLEISGQAEFFPGPCFF